MLLSKTTSEVTRRSRACSARGSYTARRGQDEGADRLAQSRTERASDLARDDFSALPFDQEWLYAASLLAETATTLGDRDRAKVLYRLLVPWETLGAVDTNEGFRGSVSRDLGLLAATLERWDEAARHFDDALMANERMGLRPWLAHTQYDYARVLFARGEPADAERAENLLDAALATYRELGMHGYAATAAASRSSSKRTRSM